MRFTSYGLEKLPSDYYKKAILKINSSREFCLTVEEPPNFSFFFLFIESLRTIVTHQSHGHTVSRIYIRNAVALSRILQDTKQIRGTHRRGVAPCYPPPGLFARVIRGPPGSEVADIRTLGFTTVEPRGNSISFRATSRREGASVQRDGEEGEKGAGGGEEKIRIFIRSRVYGRPRVYIQPRPFITASRENLEEVAPFRAFCSVPFRS